MAGGNPYWIVSQPFREFYLDSLNGESLVFGLQAGVLLCTISLFPAFI